MLTKENRLPRTEVYKPFAVLLMRSCYDAVDALNFVPMDKFQKDFFLLRQNEWEKYLAENDCKQGDLSNPQYFDFISAAQFATISQQMVDAQKIFEERTGAEGTMTVVSRDADLQDNEQLPSAFFKVAGDKMYDGLMANFTGELFFTQPPIPVAPDASDDQVVAALTQLYKKMVELGYALEVKVSADDVVPPQALLQEAAMVKTFASAFAASGAVPASAGSLSQAKGRRVCFTLKAPATLWGRQVPLRLRVLARSRVPYPVYLNHPPPPPPLSLTSPPPLPPLCDIRGAAVAGDAGVPAHRP
jgi:hypothetical protein